MEREKEIDLNLRGGVERRRPPPPPTKCIMRAEAQVSGRERNRNCIHAAGNWSERVGGGTSEKWRGGEGMLHGVVRDGKRHLLPSAVWYMEEEEGNTHTC